ncbi:hypothetical protein BDV32DRAFT_67876 [Aspergillus pseudonomiae]|uniref:Uncharacterized protein n=1 Tax=Aspergillus pseudonomiae TaxID=1506151 RepID=A0A5N6HZ76_9EURO|nr:uncharacterized protein BDV37DRAFT_182093 [Aspergillus pseudonomiae]KAB8258720.1 hypothetical protein BDV32DRAFT_67876 [Aspergillus pseudonomiae]KAE8401429.1 hypothetical protein BDV37DRAFT_182093 [Aspergillus pseudonomiae]
MMHVSGHWKTRASRRRPVGSSHEKDSTRKECFRVIMPGAGSGYGGQRVPEVGPVTSGASTVLEKSKKQYLVGLGYYTAGYNLQSSGLFHMHDGYATGQRSTVIGISNASSIMIHNPLHSEVRPSQTHRQVIWKPIPMIWDTPQRPFEAAYGACLSGKRLSNSADTFARRLSA